MSVSLSIREPRFIYFALFIGNLFEHFNKALFSLLAPFIATFFFPTSSLSLSLALFFFPTSLVIKPLSALLIGKFTDHVGKRKTLVMSLMGISLFTLAIGLLPTYEQVGVLSPLLLFLLRIGLDFFSIAERSGSILLILEKTENKKKPFICSLYESSGMIGYLLASFTIALLYHFDALYPSWRFLFFSSFLTFSLALYLQKHFPDYPSAGEEKISFWRALKEVKLPFLTIVLMVGFSYANYEIVVKLMHALLSVHLSGSEKTILLSTSAIIGLDLLLFPVFGYLASKIGSSKLILISLVATLLSVIPLFLLLKTPSISSIFFVRSTLILLGVCHASTLQYWMVTLLPKERQFTLFAFGKALGASLIGYPSVSLSLFLYHKTQQILIPGIYIALTASLALFSFCLLKTQKRAYTR